MGKDFTIAKQWKDYLKRAGLDERTANPVQISEMRKAYYGGAGDLLLLMRDELTDVDDDQGADVLGAMLQEIAGFWEKEVVAFNNAPKN